MLDRVSIFGDPEVAELLRTRFVALAVDAWYLNRSQAADGEFYRKVVTQDPSRRDMNSSTQGRYAFHPDGTLYGFNNNRDLARIKALLQNALAAYKPAEAGSVDAAKKHAAFDRTVPEGALVVDVHAKVLAGYEPTENRLKQIFQSSIGEDRLWVRKDEAEALAKGALPESLVRRIGRFHLTDFTRGEPDLWRAEELKVLDLKLAEGRLTGKAHLETADGRRGFEAELLGFVESKDGKVLRFDLVAHGQAWGEGTYTRGAPKGRFPLAVAFRLADRALEASKVPPQGARDLGGYLK